MTRRTIEVQRVEIPLTGPAQMESRSLHISAQDSLNLIPVISPREETHYVQRPGLKAWGTSGSSGRGLHRMGSTLYAVAGTSLYSVASSGVPTSLGTIAGSGRVYMADDGTNLIISNGQTMYLYDGSLSTISDPQLPVLPTHPTFLDTYILVVDGQDRGQFHWAQPGDPTDWGALTFATAEGCPDDLIAMVANRRELWLFGTDSIEIWFNDGDTPFSRIAGGFLEVGCGGARTPVNLDTVYWLGNDGVVYRGRNLEAERISHAALESEIAGYTSDPYGMACVVEGHKFYVLTWDEGTWVYDATSGEWTPWKSWGESHWAVVDVCRAYNKNIAQAEDGTLLEMDFGTYTDNGTRILRQRVTAPLTALGKSFSVHLFEAEIDTGHTEVTDPQMWLEYSADRGRTWSDREQVSIGNDGQYNQRVFWVSLGSFRDAVFRLSQTDDVRSNWLKAWADIEVNGN